MASLTQAKRESLYKIERININKLIIAIFITVVLLVAISLLSNFVIPKVMNQNVLNIIKSQ